MILGVISARAGSKGIPGKNVKRLAGRPLIDYTFEAAQVARTLDRVWLSTDIPEAIKLAKRFPRVETPFVRPPELCSDTATLVAVLAHAIQWMKQNEGRTPDAVVLLQPTSPFRTSADIDAGVAEFHRTGASSLIGVAEPICHPADCVLREAGSSSFKWVFRPSNAGRRQEYGEVHYITGALYVSRSDLVVEHQKIFDERSVLFRMNDLNALDIDSDREWRIAEAVIEVGAQS